MVAAATTITFIVKPDRVAPVEPLQVVGVDERSGDLGVNRSNDAFPSPNHMPRSAQNFAGAGTP